MVKRNKNEQLLNDFNNLERKARTGSVQITPEDGFALGYLCGKYNLDRLCDEHKGWLIDAVQAYDKTDDLALLDSIGRILVELGELSEF